MDEKVENKEPKVLTNEQFGHIMNVMRDAKASLPLEMFISIVSDIVSKSNPDDPVVKMLAEQMRKEPTESVISKTVLTMANSIVVSIYNLFGPKLEELAKKNNELKDNGDKGGTA